MGRFPVDNNSRSLVTGMVFREGFLPRWVQVLNRGLQVELAGENVEEAGQVPAQESPPVLSILKCF